MHDSEDTGDSCGEDNLEHYSFYGAKFNMWFEIGIEGKDPMDKDEEDWRGKLEFGFSEKKRLFLTICSKISSPSHIL